MLNKQESRKVQNYLMAKFGNDVQLTPSNAPDCMEVFMDGEFMGTLYRDEDDGEVSYTFTMSILESDLD